jgi:hypothetical protein
MGATEVEESGTEKGVGTEQRRPAVVHPDERFLGHLLRDRG